jgi:hypothetical protein
MSASPNFARLDTDRPEPVASAGLYQRGVVGRRACRSRARRQTRDGHSRGALNIYRLRDEPRAIILVACTKCDWKAAYSRDELIALHGADRAMPDLLDHLAAPGCHRIGSNLDRCGAHFVEPMEGAR